MSQFNPERSEFRKLQGKVVVLTGGANGIGAATVRLLHGVGALVVFGDLATSAAETLLSSLGHPDTITFLTTDVTKYADQLGLFKTAHRKYGRVDHAVPLAGLVEQGKWFDPDLTLETVEREETTRVLDVNLLAVMNFARIAVVYLRHQKDPNADKSLTLISSVAGIIEAPGLWVYQCSKHGVAGLLRTMRKPIYARDGIRVNAVYPDATDTVLARAIVAIYRRTGLPVNTPNDVAVVILGLMCDVTVNGNWKTHSSLGG